MPDYLMCYVGRVTRFVPIDRDTPLLLTADTHPDHDA